MIEFMFAAAGRTKAKITMWNGHGEEQCDEERVDIEKLIPKQNASKNATSACIQDCDPCGGGGGGNTQLSGVQLGALSYLLIFF